MHTVRSTFGCTGPEETGTCLGPGLNLSRQSVLVDPHVYCPTVFLDFCLFTRLSVIIITAKHKELSRKGANELDGILFASDPLFTPGMT